MWERKSEKNKTFSKKLDKPLINNAKLVQKEDISCQKTVKIPENNNIIPQKHEKIGNNTTTSHLGMSQKKHIIST